LTETRRLIPIIFFLVQFFAGGPLNAAEMYHDQELFAEPSVHSEKAGIAPKGEVSIVERRGFWVKVRSGEVVGWTKLSNVKMEETMIWMPPIDILKDTGRLASGN